MRQQDREAGPKGPASLRNKPVQENAYIAFRDRARLLLIINRVTSVYFAIDYADN